MKRCPYCSAALPEEVSFCPYCAKSVNVRTAVPTLRRIPRRVRLGVWVLAVLVLLALFGWRNARPQVYDNGTAEAVYTNENGTYQICIAWANTPFTPCNDRYNMAELNFNYRYPALLYVNHVETDTHAGQVFLQTVERVTAEFVDPPEALGISCTQPQPDADYVPDAACISYVDYSISEQGTCTAQLVFTLHMKNGDIIRVRQNQHFETIPTYDYTPEDAPMETLEALQSFIDGIERTIQGDAIINIHLPPVTYDGGLTLANRSVNLIGSTDGEGNRTTFTGTMQVTEQSGRIFYFNGIDFVGDDTGVGLSASARLHLTGCRVAGWKTGALAYGYSWVNADECVFEDNIVGLQFNSIGSNVSDTRYEENVFQNNGTAVLLESVPTDVSMRFPGCTFAGNEKDFDNQCGQTLELSEATFQ